MSTLWLAEAARAPGATVLSTEYSSWWPHPVRVLRPGGLLVADNALSHPGEIAPFHELLVRDPALLVTTIAVGKGELVALRR